MLKPFLTLALAALAVAPVLADGPVIYGTVAGNYPGVYRITPETATNPVSVYQGDNTNGMTTGSTGGVFTPGRFSFVYWDSSSSYTKPVLKGYNHNGEFANWSNDPWVENLPVTSAHTTLAYDPLTEAVYGCFYNTDKTTFFFGSFDPVTGLSTKICDLDERLNSMAFTEMGQLYAISISGKLLKLNADNQFAMVGQLSVKPNRTRAAGAVIDADNTMYWSVYDSNYEYGFYTINLQTATVTKVCELSQASYMTAMTIPAAAPSPEAPAALGAFSATSAGFSTDMTVSFTVPSTTVGGETIMAGLKAYVVIDGQIVTDAQVVGPGTAFSQTYTVADGAHTVVAFVTNYAGTLKSEKSKTTIFVGQDLPGAVTDLQSVRTDTGIDLSWQAPVTGATGGAFDTSSLTYTVREAMSDTVLAEGLTDCEYSYPATGDELRRVQFEVTAVTTRGAGPVALTEQFLLGEGYAVPYTEDFNGKTLDDTFFTIINSNADTYQWVMDGNQISLQYNRNAAADDWAITAPIILRKNHEYKLTFTYKVNRYPTDRLEVKMGVQPTVEAMTQTVMELKDYPMNSATPDVVTFSVAESGVYYIGFHALNDADTYKVILDDISVTYADEDHAEPTAVPAAVSDLSLTPDMMNVNIAFTVPSLDADGGNHPDVNRAELYRDNTLLRTFKYVDAGDVLTHTDTLDTHGDYEYAVVIHNAAGASQRVAATVNVNGDPSSVAELGNTSLRILPGAIITPGAAEIYTLEGLRVAVTDRAAVINLPAGLYIVKSAAASHKAMVR